MHRIIVAIGGGEIRNKTTLEIDRYIAGLGKRHARGERGYALFFPTASHDSKPYFNSFRKTYTSEFDMKSDVALVVTGEMSRQAIVDKIQKADLIYVGGGDTAFLIQTWQEMNLDMDIIKAYLNGVPLAGLSAGGICWFEKVYSDSDIIAGKGSGYMLLDGLGLLQGCCCPHYDERGEFDQIVANSNATALAIESDAAAVFVDEELVGALSSGGKVYLISPDGKGGVIKEEVPLL